MIGTGFQKINQAAEKKAEREKGGKEINEIHKSLLEIKTGLPALKGSPLATPTKNSQDVTWKSPSSERGDESLKQCVGNGKKGEEKHKYLRGFWGEKISNTR